MLNEPPHRRKLSFVAGNMRTRGSRRFPFIYTYTHEEKRAQPCTESQNTEICLDTLGVNLLDKKNFSPKNQREDIFRGGCMLERTDEDLLNSRQVAMILDLSPDTVNEFARKNILPAFKKGKQWRFRKRDISIFYKKQNKDIRDA